MVNNPNKMIPVYILAGFLGSGKTTLLLRLLEQAKHQGLKAAVLMNEIGDVNLDGLEIESDIPMKEMLSGCICCTVSGDLSMEILRLSDEHQPDVIFVECSGVANPMELLDGVTEASLLLRMDLKGIVTVMDAALLYEQNEKGKGQTYRLMKEQLRAASLVVLNKMDLVTEEQAKSMQTTIQGWNERAQLVKTVSCELDEDTIWSMGSQTHVQEPNEKEPSSKEGSQKVFPFHPSHNHVTVMTQYMDKPIDSDRFERLMQTLPDEVYRAKGILTFTDTNSRFMFQYAYRQLDFMKIMPQREVPDVAVFIGEHFDADLIKRGLEELLSE
ncbi:MAG: cobalamin biosynthesis protein CobW [Paenibacillus sp.]|jgi:G3E family GTPase|nr:cobalamin biosynthesis protein CobW [Paenibacillus sp.]